MMTSYEKPHIHAVIFDLDGLLIDSEPIWQKAYLEFLDRKNAKDGYKFSKNRVGMGLREIIVLTKKELGLKEPVDELVEELRGIFYKMFFEPGNLFLLKGAGELIRQLFRKKILAMATGGHDQKMAGEILRRLDVLKYFDLVVSSDDVKRGKPAPDTYLYIAGKINVESSECLVFEDSANGVLAAKAAGMQVYGVNADSKVREDLKHAGADEVFSNLGEIKL